MKLWDARQRRETAAFGAHTDFVSDLALHEPRQTLLAVSGDGTLTATDLRTNKARPGPRVKARGRCHVHFCIRRGPEP